MHDTEPIDHYYRCVLMLNLQLHSFSSQKQPPGELIM